MAILWPKGGPHLAWDGGAQTFSRPGVAMLKISSWQPLLDREDLPPMICRVDGKSYFVSKKYYLLGSLSKSKMGMDVGDVGWKLDNPLRRPRSDFFRWPSPGHPGTSQLGVFYHPKSRLFGSIVFQPGISNEQWGRHWSHWKDIITRLSM